MKGNFPKKMYGQIYFKSNIFVILDIMSKIIILN